MNDLERDLLRQNTALREQLYQADARWIKQIQDITTKLELEGKIVNQYSFDAALKEENASLRSQLAALTAENERLRTIEVAVSRAKDAQREADAKVCEKMAVVCGELRDYDFATILRKAATAIRRGEAEQPAVCYWDQPLDTLRCPKHGGPIGECPTVPSGKVGTDLAMIESVRRTDQPGGGER